MGVTGLLIGKYSRTETNNNLIMTAKTNLALRLACWITGNPIEILKTSDFNSKSRVFTYAFGIILTMVLAASSTYLMCTETLNIVSNNGIVTSVIIVPILIGIFDRIIIHSSHNKKTAFFRFCVSLMLALITASGIENFFFRDDIKTQVEANRNKKSKEIEAEIDSLFNVERKGLEGKVKKSQEDYETKNTIAMGELDSKYGRGPGKNYRAKRLEADKSLHYSDSLRLVLSSFDSSVVTEKSKKVSQFKKQPSGILEKSKALLDVAKSNIYAMVIYISVLLICMLLDLVPLTIKMWSDETPYENSNRVLREILIRENESLLLEKK